MRVQKKMTEWEKKFFLIEVELELDASVLEDRNSENDSSCLVECLDG